MKLFTLNFVLFLLSISLYGQVSIEPIAFELRAPVGIEQDFQGNLWVAESGTGQNNGAVTLITNDGATRRVIDGLPSFFDSLSNETKGPLRAQIIDDYIGVFTSEVPGDLSGSILLFDRAQAFSGDSILSVDNAVHQIKISDFVLSSGFAESNPYSMTSDGCDMYIADAAANAIIKRDGLTGRLSVLAEFPVAPNPLPFGPPVYEVVPTRVRMAPSGNLWVSSLTGFPFLDGASNMWKVEPSGAVSVIDSGYTLATDFDFHPEGNGFYTLQFAQFRGDSTPPFVFNSAQIVHASSERVKDTIAAGFGPSAGMVVGADGSFYVTHYFFGQVLKINPGTTSTFRSSDQLNRKLKIYPNPSAGELKIELDNEVPGQVQYEVYNMLGQRIRSDSAGYISSGSQTITININNGQQEVTPGNHLLVMKLEKQVWSQLISFQ